MARPASGVALAEGTALEVTGVATQDPVLAVGQTASEESKAPAGEATSLPELSWWREEKERREGMSLGKKEGRNDGRRRRRRRTTHVEASEDVRSRPDVGASSGISVGVDEGRVSLTGGEVGAANSSLEEEEKAR